MPLLSFDDLWKLLSDSDESVSIEAKTSSEVGKSIAETVSAFSNEPHAGGGYLLLGVEKNKSSSINEYAIVGVPNSDKLQSDIATQCCDMFSVVIRPEICPYQVSGKTVIVVYIPEASDHQKPVFIKSRGIVNGSFRRIGPTDQKCTDVDIATFHQVKSGRSYDETPIEGTSLDDIDKTAVKDYRSSRAAFPVASELLSLKTPAMLYQIGAVENDQANARLTLGGLLLFGKQIALRRKLPMVRVDYIRVEGTEWLHGSSTNYTSTEHLSSLIVGIPKIISVIFEDLPTAFSLPNGQIYRSDVPVVPKRVIREAVVNALMHRSYQIEQPVQIIRFANRIEIKNPGFSLMPIDQFGGTASRPRNRIIAAALHDIGLAETKGTGIRVMQNVMKEANLSVPVLESDRERDEFRLKLLVHHFFCSADVEWLTRFKSLGLSPMETRGLIALRETGQISNSAYRQINSTDMQTASYDLRRLRSLGLLEVLGGGSGVRYAPGPNFLAGPKRKLQLRSAKSTESLSASESDKLSGLRQELSLDTVARIDSLKDRVPRETLLDLIREICNVRPMSEKELALLLSKNRRHLAKNILAKSGIPRSRSKDGTNFIYGIGDPGTGRRMQRSDRKPAVGLKTVLTESQRQELSLLRQEVSLDIRLEIGTLKKRVSIEVLNELILKICRVRPMQSYEIGLLLSRNPEHLRNRNLRQLLYLGKLAYTHPEEPRHPHQAYKTT